jgi:hypothetical protein
VCVCACVWCVCILSHERKELWRLSFMEHNSRDGAECHMRHAISPTRQACLEWEDVAENSDEAAEYLQHASGLR